jgi:indole-3-glycerol phosphate synthase
LTSISPREEYTLDGQSLDLASEGDIELSTVVKLHTVDRQVPSGKMRDELLTSAQKGVEQRMLNRPLSDLEGALVNRDKTRPFREALGRAGVSVIAEFKRMSPSLGDISPDASLETMVKDYEAGGAAAISVLTEAPHFGARPGDLASARVTAGLPILCKDFIVHPYQLYEAAVNGADAVLLIVEILDDEQLAELYEIASSLDLDCLVEVKNSVELERALAIDADVIGINNRSFDAPFLTEKVELENTHSLANDVPTGKTVVSESGIKTRSDIEELERIGVDAVLIGTALMRADNPKSFLQSLSGHEEGTREHYLP